MPLWPTTLVLTFLFAFLLMLGSQDTQATFDGIELSQPSYAITLALMLLRDACILLFFAFGPNSRRAVGAAALYLLLLDALLPFLARIAGLDTLRYFFLPFEGGEVPWGSALVMTVHVAIAIGLVNWRLRMSEEA